jgi:RNA polymerase sigma factor (sigma-70 family)
VEIVARHQAMVCGVALGVLGDFAASEDAAQEAFLTAWRKIHELREPERLRPWLAQIARNAALGSVRRQRGHEMLENAPERPDDAPTPDAAAASAEETALVRESLAALPETYRLPLILFYREAQSVRAVAEALGISEDAVKQRLARGREMLRDRVEGVVENVLKRTGPTPVFTMTIAVAIGALAAPAAIAGSVFAASAVSTGATTGSTAWATQFLSAMSATKTVFIVAALVTAICIPVGYHLSEGRSVSRDGRVASRVESETSPAVSRSAPSFEESALFAEWRELHDRYGTNASAMRALYKVIADLKDPFRRRAFRTALIAEWAQVDPAGGLAFFLGKEPDETQRRQFLEEWLARDARAAVDALLVSDPGWEEVARECLPEIARRLPSRVAAVTSRLPKGERYYESKVREAFAILAEQDLASARQAAEGVTGASREEALGGIATVWARSDFSEAVAWAGKLPEGTDRDEVIRAALLGKASIDPVTALESVGLVPSGGRHAYSQSTTGARVLSEAAKADFDSTVAWLAAHPGRLGREDLMGLSQAVTDRLNADAPGFLTRHATEGSLAALLPAIGSALLNQASSQKAAVWDWLQTQPKTEASNELKQEVLNFAGFQDPELALRLVADLPATVEGDAQVKSLAKCLMNGGRMIYRFDTLLEQAPERLRQPLIDAAFGYLNSETMTDPQPWIARLAQLPETARPRAIESIARGWADQAPEEAIAWTATLTPGEARNGAAAAIASKWAARDVPGASAWITELPLGPERDRAAGAFAVAIAEQFPREAWDWALSIEDTGERTRAATQAAKTMAARDPATARQWIETGPFAPEVKAEIQSAIDQSSRSPALR